MPLLTVTALSEAGAVASFDVAAIMQAAVTSVQGDLFKVLGIVVPLLSPLSVPVLLSDMVLDG